ncbi:MAG: hypothetical protein WC527_03885 [Candidatus Margulisiibacteriota bacterium]
MNIRGLNTTGLRQGVIGGSTRPFTRFAVDERGALTRLARPTISIRTRTATSLGELLLNNDVMAGFYVRSVEDSHGYPAARDSSCSSLVKDGLFWSYTRKSTDEVFADVEALLKDMHIKMKPYERAFFIEHVIPLLPERFAGTSLKFHTPGYDGDPGVGYADATPSVDLAEPEIRQRLGRVHAKEDVARHFNFTDILASSVPHSPVFSCLSINAKIAALLMEPEPPQHDAAAIARALDDY